MDMLEILKTNSYEVFQDYNKLEVSGLFSKGLGISSEGIHIAFAAGTGVLTFMDLVAQIALHNLGFSKN